MEAKLQVYKYDHPFFRLYANVSFASIPLGLLFFALGVKIVGFIYIVSGMLGVAYTRRATGRRYLVDPSFYRVPRNVRLSNYLATRLHIFDNIRIITILGLNLIVTAFSSSYVNLFIMITLASFPIINIYPALEGLVKFHFDNSFRIVLFRRYAEIGALNHKRYVMPICGLYGQVLLLTDNSLNSAWEGIAERRVRWVLSECYQPLIANHETEDWKILVEEQLRYADFAVLDWSEEISQNMEWELVETLKWLPLDRIVILTSGDKERAYTVAAQVGVRPEDINRCFAIMPTDKFTNLIFCHLMQRFFTRLKISSRPEEVAAFFMKSVVAATKGSGKTIPTS